MKKNKFEPGDTVRILDGDEMATFNWSEYPTVTRDMIGFFGKLVTIERVIFDSTHNTYIYHIKDDDNMFAWKEEWLTSSLTSPSLIESVVKFCREVCILECSQECPLYKFKDK